MKSFLRMALALLLFLPAALMAQTLNFAVSSTTTGGPTITPRLTWTTSPAATACTASGAPGWSGVKGPTGVATLAAISQSQTYTLACTWPGQGSTALTWTAPTENTDGTPFTAADAIKSYVVNYATSAALLNSGPNTRAVNQANAVSATVTDLNAGTYFFCVRAVSLIDRFSDCSNVIQKVVAAGTSGSINRTAGLVFVRPNPPTNLE